ncbi:MAG: DUF2793 domain-containing protein [Rickettsiales bacterium]
MATTNNLGITLVEQSQAQKEVTVNQALTRLDAILNIGAISRTTDTPPGSPAESDLYIVGSSPTGEWGGHANEIAYYEQNWKFIVPNEGMSLWVSDESTIYLYDGSAWIQSIGGDLEAIEALSSTGFSVRTGTDSWATRIITAGTGISISNGNGVGGNTIVSFNAGLSNMNDTSIVSPVDGEVLTYSGGTWRNKKGPAITQYNFQSVTSYTLLASNSGTTLYFTSSSPVTLSLPDSLLAGYNIKLIQAGSGQVTCSTTGGAILYNRQSHTKTDGQWAVCTLEVVNNVGGVLAEYVLSGDTSS